MHKKTSPIIEPSNTSPHDYAKQIHENPPDYGFSESQKEWMTSATHNNKKYVKGLLGVENQFFDMLKEHMSEDIF